MATPAWLRSFGQLLRDPWSAIDADTKWAEKRGLTWDALAILVTVAVVLTLQEYLGNEHMFRKWFPAEAKDPYVSLKGHAWWAGWRIGGYIILPCIVIWAMGRRVRDLYLSPSGFLRHLPIYLGLFAAVAPFVWWVSSWPSFQHTYPFYKLAHRSLFDLLAWEAMYAVQFLALEFFFRGFMLEGLRRHMGSLAIAVMLVPYCMIHYGKPMPETLGAILAGAILGTVAMRTRSIWGGVAIHVAVAVMMDLLALRR